MFKFSFLFADIIIIITRLERKLKSTYHHSENRR